MIRRAAVAVPEVSTPLSPGESVRLKTPRLRAMGSVIGHTGFSVARYHSTYVFGALIPMAAGFLLFGWRAVGAVAILMATTIITGVIWRRIGLRGHPLRPAQILWQALVLSLMMPASLLARGTNGAFDPWPILPAAAMMLVIFAWGVGSYCPGRLHPAVTVFVLLAIPYHSILQAHTVLQRQHLLSGDVLNATAHGDSKSGQNTWIQHPLDDLTHDALHPLSTQQSLIDFTGFFRATPRWADSIETLLRDGTPPLQDVVLGATPGAIGASSTIAVIVGGLFLLYRGLLDFRIPLLIFISAWLLILVLPLRHVSPVTPGWTWAPGHAQGVGWASAVTFANYETLASPLLFTSFFLAGSPTVRPMGKSARAVYAVLIGVMAAIFQLYLTIGLGSYISLTIAGLAGPMLDRLLIPRALV